MAEKGKKIVEQLQLENGIALKLYDQSRLTAGDRWLVELKCEAEIPLTESCWSWAAEEDPGLVKQVRSELGRSLVYSAVRQRNFVDAGEREEVLREMVEQVFGSVLEYLKKPHFPEEYFKKRFRETCQGVRLRKAMDQAAT